MKDIKVGDFIKWRRHDGVAGEGFVVDIGAFNPETVAVDVDTYGRKEWVYITDVYFKRDAPAAPTAATDDAPKTKTLDIKVGYTVKFRRHDDGTIGEGCVSDTNFAGIGRLRVESPDGRVEYVNDEQIIGYESSSEHKRRSSTHKMEEPTAATDDATKTKTIDIKAGDVTVWRDGIARPVRTTSASPKTPDEYHAKKFDGGKARMDLLPWAALVEVGRVLEYGCRKYAEDSWRDVPDACKRYMAAMFRHAAAIQEGEAVDSESGLHHAAHMACNALFVCWLTLKGK